MKKFLLSLVLLAVLCVPASGGEVRLGIMGFTSKVPEVPDERAAAISDYFLRTLVKAHGIRLVERERIELLGGELKAGTSGMIDSGTAAEIGKLAGCTHMLLGALTNLTNITTRKGFAGVYFRDKKRIRATLDVRIVKVETGDIIFAEGGTAEVSRVDEGYSVFNIEKKNSGFDGLEGSAIAEAVVDVTPAIVSALNGTIPNLAVQARIKARHKYENSSTDPAKVIESYGLEDEEAEKLTARHKKIRNYNANATKSEEFAKLYRENNIDYLAAYSAALAEFNMYHGGAAVRWCDRALETNPRYYPAKSLRKQAAGIIKR